ncbi:hypothetical protein [Glycomyces harbinensis]|uniref:Uncharacterized protein n=1 Tax=Glycomyces harbinensis TaxID=58114 RepID=A0A1G7CT13_9ACTN|nr:hypothetical protein [Glycomyces harbinensis]SDE42447.1 hypothetical protein SAMN05216270_12114 [Glycomyces harbinensis]
MRPLLTPPGVDAAPIEAVPGRARSWPPAGVRALQLLLLAEAAAVVWIWQWTWHGVQAYAWPGVDNALGERGLSYLLILAPAIPVNLLAAIWLDRGGRRAQLYLAASGGLAAVQLVLLLTPAAMPMREAMSDGAATVGMRFLFTVVPIVFAAALLAAGTATRTWLGGGPDRAGRRLAGVEAAVWCLALALAIGTGTDVHRWAEAASLPEEPRGEHTEDGTWARLESAVADTVAAIPAFSGFAARHVDVVDCDYRTPAGLATYRYRLTYELRAADFAAYEAAVAARWAEGDYELTYDGATLEGTRRITAERVDELALQYTGGEDAALHLESACVERVDQTPACLPPQGEPTTDRVEGITCPETG